MGWNSATQSMLIDLAIVGALFVVAVTCARLWKMSDASTRNGFLLTLLGFVVVGLLHAFNLAQELQRQLIIAGATGPIDAPFQRPSILASIINFMGVGAICIGLIKTHRAILGQHKDLANREATLAGLLAAQARADTEAQESDNLLDSIIENLPVAILIKDKHLQPERANRKFVEWSGLDMAGLTATGDDRLRMEVTPFTLNDLGKEVLSDLAPKSRRVECAFPDGYAHTIQITDFPIFDTKGEVVKVGSVMVDLTSQLRVEKALRESEQRYRNIFDFAPYPIYIQDGVKLLVANVEAARTYGYDSPDEMVGIPVLDLIHPDDRPRFKERLAQFRAGASLPFIEERRIRKDGATIIVVQSGTPIPWRGNRAVLAINRDVTEERRNADQLRQAQKMETIGQLTAGVAHDFNNILGIILGNAELLDDRLGANNPQSDAIQKSALSGARLTQRLLAFSRKQVLQPIALDAAGYIQDLKSLLERTIGEHIKVEVETEPGLWLCGCDPTQLENAIVNLAINGRDAMPEGGVLRITTSNVELHEAIAAEHPDVWPGQYVEISVADTGFGIPSHILPNIFEPFFTTKGVGKGSGLGLSMVYGFVKQSGGHIDVESTPGEGAVIKLYMPRTTAAAGETPAFIPDLEAPLGRGESIMVVEDDDDIRSLTIAMLMSMGYAVMQASTADEALQLLQASPTDLVLTDIVLAGGMNGREMIEKMRSTGCPSATLFMSGYAKGDMGPDDILLAKPFRKDELARAVRMALDGGGRRRALT